MDPILNDINYITLKMNHDFNDYLLFMTSIGLNTDNWIDQTKGVDDLVLDAIDAEEILIVTEILINEADNTLHFKITSSEDTFDPVYTTFTLFTDQMVAFLSKYYM